MDENLIKCYNRFLIPLLQPDATSWQHDQQSLAGFQAISDEALANLKPLLEQLDSFHATSEQQAQEVRNLHSYFVAWRELLQTTQRLLKQPERWNIARQNVVRTQVNSLFVLRKPLEENTTMPRFNPLVTAGEPRPPAPPPNTA